MPSKFLSIKEAGSVQSIIINKILYFTTMRFFALTALVALASSLKLSEHARITPVQRPAAAGFLQTAAADAQCDAIHDIVDAAKEATSDGETMDFGEWAMILYDAVMKHAPQMLEGPHAEDFARGMMNWAYESFEEADTNHDHHVDTDELAAEIKKHADNINC